MSGQDEQSFELNEDLLMLFDRMPGSLDIYLALEARIRKLFPDAKRKISKTQVGFSNRYGFAYASLPARKVKDRPETYVILTFGLGRRVEHPRIAVATEPYPGRWTHHTLLTGPQDIDRQVDDWLREAYEFSLQK